MENYELFKKTPFFAGISEDEADKMLNCLGAREKAYKRGEYIMHAGDKCTAAGLVAKGRVTVLRDDFWGGREVLGVVLPGDVFGEVYACTAAHVAEASAVADEDTRVIFVDIARVLTVCPSACTFHARLTSNLTSMLAEKALQLSRKAQHMAKKTLREKALSYLSAVAAHTGKSAFEIPFNRQELADYLGTDRSALSAELSRLKKEGLIDYKKNRFELFEV